MGFGEAVRTCFGKSFVWRGRASIAEFWWFTLALSLAAIVVDLLELLLTYITQAFLDGLLLQALFAIVSFFPSLAATIRRLHDTGRNGAWFWLAFVPFVGAIVLFVFMLLPSDPHENRYGPNPHAHPAPSDHPDQAAVPDQAPVAVPARQPVSRPGLHWCATPGCPMYQSNVGQETCYSCGQPTQETEPV